MAPRRIVAAAVLGLAGCGQSQPAEKPVAVVVVPEPSSVPAQDDLKPAPVPVPAAPPVFAFPPDLAGQALAQVVAPADPTPLPVERSGDAPKERLALPAVTSPDPFGKPSFRPPHVGLLRAAGLKPVAPREGVPVEIGANAQSAPAKPKLPDAAPPAARARDVNLPPALPILGRPQSDRAALDDPTAEHGREAIVSPRVGVPLAPAAFRKAVLPDPFELGEQVKPKVPPAAEPAATPVPVSPQRK